MREIKGKEGKKVNGKRRGTKQKKKIRVGRKNRRLDRIAKTKEHAVAVVLQRIKSFGNLRLCASRGPPLGRQFVSRGWARSIAKKGSIPRRATLAHYRY